VKKIFLISVFFVVFFSVFTLNSNEVFAQPAECPGGLVPCGRSCDNPDTSIREDHPCSLCHIFYLTKNIIDFVLVKIVFPLAVLLLVVGGAMFLLAAGDPGKVNQGKSIMKAVVIGLLIIVAAWVIVNTFFVIIDVSDWTGLEGGWFTIICTLPPPPPVDQCNSGPDCDDSNPCTKDVCQNPTFNNSVCQNDNLLVNTDCGDCKECNPFGACSIDLCDPAIGMCFSNTCFPLYPWYIVQGSTVWEIKPIESVTDTVSVYNFHSASYYGDAVVLSVDKESMIYLHQETPGPNPVDMVIVHNKKVAGVTGTIGLTITGINGATLAVKDDAVVPGGDTYENNAGFPYVNENTLNGIWGWQHNSDGAVITDINWNVGCITVKINPALVATTGIVTWKFVTDDGFGGQTRINLNMAEQLQICKNP